MIQATEKNIEWLCGRLYELRRHMQDNGCHPVFVLKTKDESDRQKVERMFFCHFQKRYGDMPLRQIEPGETSSMHTRLYLPDVGASVVLMDAE